MIMIDSYGTVHYLLISDEICWGKDQESLLLMIVVLYKQHISQLISK